MTTIAAPFDDREKCPELDWCGGHNPDELRRQQDGSEPHLLHTETTIDIDLDERLCDGLDVAYAQVERQDLRGVQNLYVAIHLEGEVVDVDALVLALEETLHLVRQKRAELIYRGSAA